MTQEERAAYGIGAMAAAEGKPRNDDHSPDWSVQREYENGFHGRPVWY
jgi:hypothetical protein